MILCCNTAKLIVKKVSLNPSSLSSPESGRKSTYSSKTTIGIVGRFLLTAQIQCLSGLIEYITVTSRKDSYEFVYPVEVLPNCIVSTFHPK